MSARRRGKLAVGAGTLLVVLLAGPARACYTGLTIIPTADVLEPGEYALDFQYDGVFAAAADDTRIVNTEFGLAPRVEAGLDFDVSRDSEARVLLNAKWQLQAPDEARLGVALGLCNFGPHAQAAPYVVATQEFGATRGHVGLMHNEGETDWFAGIEQAVGERLSLLADYTSGAGNQASLAASVQFSDSLGLLVGVAWPNAAGEDTAFTVQFLIGGTLSKTGGGK